jgi:hypothetical protein
VEAIEKVSADGTQQSVWARQIAEEYFNSEVVLNNLLAHID